MRASDRDRDVVHGVLAEAYADGRLTRDEHDERSSATSAAKTLGDLVPVITDLVPVNPARVGTDDLALATPDDLQSRAVRRWQHQRREAIERPKDD